jgi:hypothetical protein
MGPMLLTTSQISEYFHFGRQTWYAVTIRWLKPRSGKNILGLFSHGATQHGLKAERLAGLVKKRGRGARNDAPASGTTYFKIILKLCATIHPRLPRSRGSRAQMFKNRNYFGRSKLLPESRIPDASCRMENSVPAVVRISVTSPTLTNT